MSFVNLNTVFDEKEQVIYGLTKIYGLGRKQSEEVCIKLGYNRGVRWEDLTKKEINLLFKKVSLEYKINKDLERDVYFKIKAKGNIKCYEGIRYRMGLPLKGQRTKTNSKTVRKLLNRKQHIE